MKHAAMLLTLLFAVALCASAGAKPIAPPQFVPVQIPGSSWTSVNAINNAGVMAGFYSTPQYHCFVMMGNRYKTLDVPKSVGDDTTCWGINSANTVVGSYETKVEIRAFLYQNGKFTDISPNAGLAVAYGINDSGLVVGTYSEDGDHNDGFLWDGVAYQRLDVPNATDTFATGINNEGIMVLQWFDSLGFVHSSLYDGSTFTNIDVPGARDTFAFAINNLGDVAATWYDSNGQIYGAILHSGVWHKVMVPGSNRTLLYGINDFDVTVGYSWKHDGDAVTGLKLIP